MFRVILLEFLCVEAELLISLDFGDAFAVIRSVNSVAIVRTISDVVTFYLAAVANVVRR